MKNFFAEFKEFIMQGNVLDLAVGVVIGSAFTAIVNQIVEGLITPLVSWAVAIITNTTDLKKSLSVLDVSPRPGVTFQFSVVISALITFLITALVLFLVVKAVNHAKSLKKQEETVEEPVLTAEDYLAEIRDLLKMEQGLPLDSPTSKEDLDS